MKTETLYHFAVFGIVERASAWLDKNVGKVQVQFNMPRDTAALMTVKAALENHLMSVSDDALALIHYAIDPDRHTVIQLKAALDILAQANGLQS